jgi:hypothetical protein
VRLLPNAGENAAALLDPVRSRERISAGSLPAVAAIVQGYVWYFHPATGWSISLYLRAKDGALYELGYVPSCKELSSQTGVWQWTELSGWVTDANQNPLPNAASGWSRHRRGSTA